MISLVQFILEVELDVIYSADNWDHLIPQHPSFTWRIDTAANTCTSLLMDDYLEHRFSAWAVTAAFGDNLKDSALQRAQGLGLTQQQLQQLYPADEFARLRPTSAVHDPADHAVLGCQNR